jgi:hypothetical protein
VASELATSTPTTTWPLEKWPSTLHRRHTRVPHVRQKCVNRPSAPACSGSGQYTTPRSASGDGPRSEEKTATGWPRDRCTPACPSHRGFATQMEWLQAQVAVAVSLSRAQSAQLGLGNEKWGAQEVCAEAYV